MWNLAVLWLPFVMMRLHPLEHRVQVTAEIVATHLSTSSGADELGKQRQVGV